MPLGGQHFRLFDADAPHVGCKPFSGSVHIAFVLGVGAYARNPQQVIKLLLKPGCILLCVFPRLICECHRVTYYVSVKTSVPDY